MCILRCSLQSLDRHTEDALCLPVVISARRKGKWLLNGLRRCQILFYSPDLRDCLRADTLRKHLEGNSKSQLLATQVIVTVCNPKKWETAFFFFSSKLGGYHLGYAYRDERAGELLFSPVP